MNSLQLAVAAYIAEHGSIDADTYQSLSDLYTEGEEVASSAKKVIPPDKLKIYNEQIPKTRKILTDLAKDLNSSIPKLKPITDPDIQNRRVFLETFSEILDAVETAYYDLKDVKRMNPNLHD